MSLRNPILKQLYLWVICYHYSYQKITEQIRGLRLWYFHLICQVFSVPSVTALYIWHTEPLRHGWIYLLCQYGALSLSLLYEVTVISLELFGYFICLNSSSEFCPLPIQCFSICPKSWINVLHHLVHEGIWGKNYPVIFRENCFLGSSFWFLA